MQSLSIKKIGLIILACVLLLSLANCGDIRLLTNREVEERLSRHYGREFTVVSSMSVSNADALGLWWAKAFVVSPKDDPVSSENLETVCTVLSGAYSDTLEKVPEILWQMSVKPTYRESAWPEDQSCLVVIGGYQVEHIDISAEGIEEYILNEVDRKLSR